MPGRLLHVESARALAPPVLNEAIVCHLTPHRPQEHNEATASIDLPPLSWATIENAIIQFLLHPEQGERLEI